MIKGRGPELGNLCSNVGCSTYFCVPQFPHLYDDDNLSLPHRFVMKIKHVNILKAFKTVFSMLSVLS